MAGFDFYEALAVDNSKTWWTAHKDTYDVAVKQPFVDLLAELEGEFGEGKVFRPYRDVRFSKEKTPYKDHQGAFVGVEDGMGWYVQVSASGLMVAGGWYSSAPKQLARYRDAVDSPLVVELEKWLRQQHAKLSASNQVAKAIAYSLNGWSGLTRFLDDGRLCMSNNAAERALRCVAVGRHNWTFAGDRTKADGAPRPSTR